MNYEIEFKMIEIRDLSKIQRSKIVQDDTFNTKIEQTEDVADEYCREIMDRVESLLDSDCKIKYSGCLDRIGNFVFAVLHDDVEYTVKYSLQGTTQGRYLTGGVPPVRFSM